ncbi:MAG TPA: sigma-54 dependent transcriptional regulator [Acidobacteriota bacterium]|nr:sigma-54 dependent transcriptional regulator [Acidobacteriota bacterium]HNH84386.1 sigma-54 dependent transcriptional regulator [Acidobacteriota bacterium]HNJ43478.1 sigma-54 dependent transcriptional regulator [Acidobacteriota bacterium]
MKHILFVDDEASFRQVMAFRLKEFGYQVSTAENGARGLELFLSEHPDLVLADFSMPELNGLELMQKIKAISPDTPVILITAFGDVATAVNAMKAGASDFLTKPVEMDQLRLTLDRVSKVTELEDENRKLRALVEERLQFGAIIGTSKRMQDLFRILERVSRTEVAVLILGESGTGKELVAKAIHQHSARKKASFVTIDCGTIPENLMESTLFGHKRGSFTGAMTDQRGLFEEANSGTVFLDEVGEVPLLLQPKLLRILQEGEFTKLGETQPRRVDVRVIAATNRDLSKMVAEGKFREDLFFRLNVIPVKLPALRERKEDIPLLANRFLIEAGNRYGRTALRFSSEVFRIFQQYAWPGNVRELKNTVERLGILAASDIIQPQDLPEEILQVTAGSGELPFSLPDSGLDLEALEKEILRQALAKHNGNRTHAARYLHMTRDTLLYRIQKFGLD